MRYTAHIVHDRFETFKAQNPESVSPRILARTMMQETSLIRSSPPSPEKLCCSDSKNLKKPAEAEKQPGPHQCLACTTKSSCHQLPQNPHIKYTNNPHHQKGAGSTLLQAVKTETARVAFSWQKTLNPTLEPTLKTLYHFGITTPQATKFCQRHSWCTLVCYASSKVLHQQIRKIIVWIALQSQIFHRYMTNVVN